MKNLILSLFLICSLRINCQTNVSGGIYTNTNWKIANSPYIVTDNLTLFQGATLTIEPGVEVKFNGNYLFDIRGTLNAIGNTNNPIKFISNLSSPVKNSWQGFSVHTEQNASLNFSYCTIKNAYNAIYFYFTTNAPNSSIINSSFENNYSGIYGQSVGLNFLVFNNNVLKNNSIAIDGAGIASLTINNCLFESNDIGLNLIENLILNNSSFCGNKIGIIDRWSIIDSCIITNNVTGILEGYDNGSSTIKNTIIALNDTGVILHNGNQSNNSYVNDKICNNKLYNIVHKGTYNFNMKNLCWCDTNNTILSNKIYDGYDNVDYGLISFSPTISCNSTALSNIKSCNSSSSSIFYIEKINTISLYPNPMQNYTTLKFDEFLKNVDIKIFDLIGRNCFNISNVSGSEITIPRNNLSSGFYYLKIMSTEKIIHTLKIEVTD